MKNKSLIIMFVLPLILAIINYQDTFYLISLIIISLTAFYGFFSNSNIWYHKSSHTVVSCIISIIIFVYECLKFVFGLLDMWVNNSLFPNFNISILILGLISIIILMYEMKWLKKKELESN